MKKSIKFERLSKEAEAFLTEAKDKIKNETNMGVFSKEEKNNLRGVYHEIVGRPAPTNCDGLCITALKIVRNWIKWYEGQVPAVAEIKNLSDCTKKELVEMYPHISPRLTKAQFIEEIQSHGEEE